MALRSRKKARSRGWFFRTKQPHHFTWLIALALAVLGVAGTRVHIDLVSPHAAWVMLAAYVLLALGELLARTGVGGVVEDVDASPRQRVV